MFKWLWRLFNKEPPKPKKKLDKDTLHFTAVRACQQIALSGRFIGTDQWGEIDACASAMKVFVETLQEEYHLSKGNLTVAHKLIHKHKWMMTTGRLI